ncbi:hypothetical protein GCM10007207_20040 [Asaia siamensis]|uniref:Uncharacterized protein n=1 Tax=Asaia siamensis TaxID=110479 RepID=A0ABQ1M490_9PROT|nr:hypothetical protein AA0323_1348 [Asaia siamensis NRIC 0323]GGC34488.1 hypothetical protein GCM10007207_20040 [Asaia siamensis]
MFNRHDYSAIASIDLCDVLKPKAPGRQVDTTVQEQPRERKPDYEAMRRLASGDDLRQHLLHDDRKPSRQFRFG